MAKRKSSKEAHLLDMAWKYTFDSMHFDVTGTTDHSQELLREAREAVHGISKDEWLPFLNNAMSERSFSDPRILAERSSTLFINNKMNTTGLKVTIQGGF